MRSAVARRAVAVLVLAWAGLSAAPARGQDPDSLIPPDPLLPPDTLDAPFLPGVDAPETGGFPWLLELPGWHGLRIEHYNRVTA